MDITHRALPLVNPPTASIFVMRYCDPVAINCVYYVYNPVRIERYIKPGTLAQIWRQAGLKL